MNRAPELWAVEFEAEGYDFDGIFEGWTGEWKFGRSVHETEEGARNLEKELKENSHFRGIQVLKYKLEG